MPAPACLRGAKLVSEARKSDVVLDGPHPALLVQGDDALGALASKLRARGLEVAIADSVASAVDRARVAPPEAVIVAAEILEDGGFRAKFAADPALARVMMTAPKLLLIDELALGLAPMAVDRLMAIVREVNSQGTTVVLVEQSVNRAMSLADQAFFLERGEVRFDGRTVDLMERTDLLRPVFLGAAVEGLG